MSQLDPQGYTEVNLFPENGLAIAYALATSRGALKISAWLAPHKQAALYSTIITGSDFFQTCNFCTKYHDLSCDGGVYARNNSCHLPNPQVMRARVPVLLSHPYLYSECMFVGKPSDVGSQKVLMVFPREDLAADAQPQFHEAFRYEAYRVSNAYSDGRICLGGAYSTVDINAVDFGYTFSSFYGERELNADLHHVTTHPYGRNWLENYVSIVTQEPAGQRSKLGGNFDQYIGASLLSNPIIIQKGSGQRLFFNAEETRFVVTDQNLHKLYTGHSEEVDDYDELESPYDSDYYDDCNQILDWSITSH